MLNRKNGFFILLLISFIWCFFYVFSGSLRANNCQIDIPTLNSDSASKMAQDKILIGDHSRIHNGDETSLQFPIKSATASPDFIKHSEKTPVFTGSNENTHVDVKDGEKLAGSSRETRWKEWELEAYRDFKFLKIKEGTPVIMGKAGFSMQKSIYQGWLHTAVRHNRTLVIPPFTSGLDHGGNTVDAQDIVSVDKMIDEFSPDMNKMAVFTPQQFAIFNEMNEKVITNLEQLKENKEEKIVSLDLTSSLSDFSLGKYFPSVSETYRWRKRLIATFVGSPRIRKEVNDKLKSITGGEYTCIHLRTEQDFINYFKYPPGYYTVEQILKKIEGSSKEWKHFKRNIYLAGYHKASVIEQFKSSGLFDQVLVKHTVFGLAPDIGGANPQTDMAALDYEACGEASSFIGNNHSSWSEAVFDRFVLVKGCAACARQVNDLESNIKDALFPFCSANNVTLEGVPCHYYRTVG
eukprot:TRINITY_DN6164_c0_g1_i1.p1 TRINITY_DN6164_c0_g1~~TRINITY_DN6164_c0_g1_i1.p1  ORF type:complete len:464 (+),score=108.85 TRINITY_DN6164_c0_g1_i1:72-1463(+)